MSNINESTVCESRKQKIVNNLYYKTTRSEWKIWNFNLLDTSNTFIESNIFETSDKTYSYSLKVGFCSGLLNVYLNLSKNKALNVNPNHKIKYKLSLINSMMESVHGIDGNLDLVNSGPFSKSHNWGLTHSYLEKRELLTDGCLTVSCELSVLHNDNVINPMSSIDTEKTLGEDLKKLLICSDFSDITLSVSGEQFKLHKGILASRSPVFAAMFANKMKEGISSQVEITNFSARTMEEFISYIYTGKSPKLKDMAADLLKAADFYNVHSLKEVCLEEMLRKLSPTTAIDLLALADNYNLPQCRSTVLDFIAVNPRQVFQSKAWQDILNSKSHLVQEVYKVSIEKNLM